MGRNTEVSWTIGIALAIFSRIPITLGIIWCSGQRSSVAVGFPLGKQAKFSLMGENTERVIEVCKETCYAVKH